MERTVLLTGCSSGIGRATAERFHDAGWEVYATARNRGDLDDLEGRGCRTAELDVTDDGQVRRVVDRVFDEAGHLDCLVNNAGYGQFGPVEDVGVDGAIRQFEVNTFGPLRLVEAALPRMRERGEGTVVTVGAGAGGLTLPGIGVYTGSKYALESMCVALRGELSGRGVDVTVVRPGVVATDFYDRTAAEVAELDHTPAYDDLYRVLDDAEVVEGGGPGINAPERVAETIFEAASADRPDPVYHVGAVATGGTLLGGVVRGRTRDRLASVGLSGLSSGPVQRLLEGRR